MKSKRKIKNYSNRKEDKTKFIFIGLTTAVIIVGLLTFSIISIKNNHNLIGALLLILGVIFLSTSLIVLGKKYRNVKLGINLERKKKEIIHLATSKAFVWSIVYLIVLSWFISIFEFLKFNVEQALGAGILGMIVIFALCWIYYDQFAKVEK